MIELVDQPAGARFRDEGAYYRRRLWVPREASRVHAVLAPLAVTLGGRVHDDDGRAVIEWLESHWPHEVAGHGRNDAFRWSLIASTRSGSLMVLLTQSLLGDRSAATLDVIAARPAAVLVPLAPKVDPNGALSVRALPEGIHFCTHGRLGDLTAGSIRSLVLTAVEGLSAPGEPAEPTKAASRPGLRRHATAADVARVAWMPAIGVVIVAGILHEFGTPAWLIAASAMLTALAGLAYVLASYRAGQLPEMAEQIRLQGLRYEREKPPRAPGFDDANARLEEGRDISDYEPYAG